MPTTDRGPIVTTAAQQGANGNHRVRLERCGFRRFEVMAPEIGRYLPHIIARPLAVDGP